MPNLMTEALSVAATGGKLTAEAQRQAEERAAAVGMVKRMQAEQDAADAAMAARRRPSGYALTGVQLGQRIDAAMRQASASAARRGFRFNSEATPDLWADCSADLAVYAMTKASTNPAERKLGRAWLAAPYGSRRADLAAGRIVARLADVAFMPTDAEVTGNLLRQRADGWIADYMRADVVTDVASIDGDAEIADALTDAVGTWQPTADADRLVAALGDDITQAERIAIEGVTSDASLKEQAAALGKTVGYVKSARSKGMAKLAERVARGDLRTAIESAGLADLTAAEKAVREDAILRASLRNADSSSAQKTGGPLAPRALSCGRILTGDEAAAILGDEHTGAMALPPLVAAGASTVGHVIDRTAPADPYSRAHLATLPLGTAARRRRAERIATRARLMAPGLGECKLPDMAQAARQEDRLREAIASQYARAAARWAARADKLAERGTACPVEQGNAERYQATADRIATGALSIGRVAMLRAPTMPRS